MFGHSRLLKIHIKSIKAFLYTNLYACLLVLISFSNEITAWK